MAGRRPRNRRKNRSPVVAWLRSLGIASILIGFFGILPTFFWFGVGAIYAGALLLLIDVVIEPDLKDSPKSKAAISFVIIAAVALFSSQVVFISLPITISALANEGQFDKGPGISNLFWRDEFRLLAVTIHNDTGAAFDDIDLLVKPTHPVASISQKTDIPNVSFEDYSQSDITTLDIDLQTRAEKALPSELIATDAGYTVRCPHLPPHAVITIALGLVDIVPPHKPPPGVPVSPGEDYREISAGKMHIWVGNRYGPVFMAPDTIHGEVVKVTGTYTARFKQRRIEAALQL